MAKYLHKKKEKRKGKRIIRKEQKKQNDETDNDDLPSDVDDPFFKEELSKLPTTSGRKLSNKGKPEELSLLVMDSDEDRNHFDYKEIVKKGAKTKKKKTNQKQPSEEVDDFKLELSDSRFTAVFDNPKFNVDPSHPSFKKTKSMNAIVEEKQKRILKEDRAPIPKQEPAKKIAKLQDPRLSSLVDSVKSKSNLIKKKSKKRK